MTHERVIDKVLLPHCTLGVEDLHELALVTGHRLSLQVKDVVLVVNAQARVGKDTARRNSKLGPLQSLSSLDLWQISHVDGGRRNYICSALSSPSQPEKPAIFHGGAALAPALDLHSTYTSTNSHTSVA